MTSLDAYLNSYSNWIIVALAMIVVLGIIKAVLINVKTIRKIVKRNLF